MNVSTQNLLANTPIFVGLDVHKETIALAARHEDKLVTERVFATKNLAKLQKCLVALSKKGQIRCCYEASGAGYHLARLIRSWGFECDVIASSLMPTLPGDRRKTDRLDAQRLCTFYQGGLLTAVHIPTKAQEAARGFVRCRQVMRKDVTRVKHQLSKFLQMKGLVYRDGTNWTGKHFAWLNRLTFDCEWDTETFQHYLSTLTFRLRRLEEMDEKIERLARQDDYAENFKILRAYRGVGTLTAMVLLTELGDIRRFSSPSKLMSYVGLTPSHHLSGESRVLRGSISKAGSAWCRHVLVQAAWNCMRRPTRSFELRKRQEGVPAWVLEHSWKAQERLHARFWHLDQSVGRSKAVVAVARELIGFLGHALIQRATGHEVTRACQARSGPESPPD